MTFSILSFPFEQIGEGLRHLSLSGAVGNVIAIILYVIISLIPCGLFLYLKKKKKLCKTDLMLPLLSIGLFITIYFMVNPGLFITGGISAGTTTLVCTFYSLVAGYLILRILEKSAHADTKTLQKWIHILLYVIILLFAYLIVVEFAFNLPANIKALKKANSAVSYDLLPGSSGNSAATLTPTYVFLVLRSIVNALPYILDILVLFIAAGAMKELLKDAYSNESVAAVQKIAGACSKALAIVVIASMSFNILQVLFRNSLYQIDITATIPILSILFIIIILMIARYMGENQKLKQDNDLFI